MIWSSVATLLNLDDLILCCFWFLCQHCSLPGSKIPRPRNRQDWFLTKTDQNSWQRTLQIVSFLAERIPRTLLFKPSPKNPKAQGHLFKQRGKRSLASVIWLRWTTTGIFYLDNYLESLASLSSASILSVHFCWKVEAIASQILLATTTKAWVYILSIMKSPLYCFKGKGGREGYVIQSFY